ncbi:Transcription factor TFIID complex subunit 8 C-term [Rhizoctonia solani]|uniref:Transcription factor TFIID complex subunit 8 C-term n=1 Tax=Rhizoctonia solani TaxID=456999 RepID=A0A8H7INK5_9AGAM|nr:Transcription factor TFIID complex subunit 8 C-term [Rhizoctonia solani]
MVAYLVIPGYAGFKIYTKFVGPMFFNKSGTAPVEDASAAEPTGPSKRQQKLQQRAEKVTTRQTTTALMADQVFAFDESPTRSNHKNSNGNGQAPSGIAITEPIASQCIQRLVQIQLRVEGFKGADRSAMDAIEREVVSYLNDTYELAVALANNSGRSRPGAQDVLKACEDGDLSVQDLKRVMKRTAKVSRSSVPMFKPAPKRRRSPELLGSDESSAGEENPDTSKTEKSKDNSNKPRTLKHLPGQLPDLPPKHSYMRTSASSFVAHKNVILIIARSPQNIVKATNGADTTPQHDLLAEVVNWETVGPQAAENMKRWNRFVVVGARAHNTASASRFFRVFGNEAGSKLPPQQFTTTTLPCPSLNYFLDTMSAPRTPVRKAYAGSTSPSKSVFATNITRGTAQARFKVGYAWLGCMVRELRWIPVQCCSALGPSRTTIFRTGAVELTLATTKLCASTLSPIFGDSFGGKFASFVVEISVPLVLIWNTIEAAYRIQWPATYVPTPPTPGPFSTPLSPAQRRLRASHPRSPSRPPSFPAPALPPSPLRSPSKEFMPTASTSPTKGDKNPFLAASASNPFAPSRSSTNPFLSGSLNTGPPSPSLRDSFAASASSSFNGKHSVGPGKALDRSMVESLVSELDR